MIKDQRDIPLLGHADEGIQLSGVNAPSSRVARAGEQDQAGVGPLADGGQIQVIVKVPVPVLLGG